MPPLALAVPSVFGISIIPCVHRRAATAHAENISRSCKKHCCDSVSRNNRRKYFFFYVNANEDQPMCILRVFSGFFICACVRLYIYVYICKCAHEYVCHFGVAFLYPFAALISRVCCCPPYSLDICRLVGPLQHHPLQRLFFISFLS